MKNYKRSVLFANGDFPENDSLTLEEDDFLVAVDGGLRHLIQLGLTPQLLVGDLDSVNEDKAENWIINITATYKNEFDL